MKNSKQVKEETVKEKAFSKLLEHYNSMWVFVEKLCREKGVDNPYPNFTKD